MNAYSKDLRIKALGALDRGMPRKEAASTFGVSLATLKRWLKRRREGEDIAPKPSPGRTPRILASQQQRRALGEQLEANHDATLARHCELWEDETGVAVSVATMSRAVRRLGWTFKKVSGGHRTGRTSQGFVQGTAKRGRSRAAEVRRRVLDQRSAHPTLRQGSQGRKGPREGAQELGQERDTHLLDLFGGDGTLDEHRGTIGYRLLRHLHEGDPGPYPQGWSDSPYGQPLRAQEQVGQGADRAEGLPAVVVASLLAGLQPIEEAFSKVKTLLRRAQARALEALFEATEDALGAVSAEDASGYFGHCGYTMPQAHSI